MINFKVHWAFPLSCPFHYWAHWVTLKCSFLYILVLEVSLDSLQLMFFANTIYFSKMFYLLEHFYNTYFNIFRNNICGKYIFKTTEQTTFAGLSEISKPSTQLFFHNRLELFSINWLTYKPLTKGWELVFCSMKEPSHFRGFPR